MKTYESEAEGRVTDTPTLTPDEVAAMLMRLGVKLIVALETSVFLGHSRVQHSAVTYFHHDDYPPTDDNDAAAMVIVEVLRNDRRPEEILARHPWLSMCIERPQLARTIEAHQRRAGELAAERVAS